MRKFSIIIPVYNVEKFVKRSIQSTINQTYKNLEILIIDDKSTDSSLKIIQSINDSRIKILLNEQNQGTFWTRNKGILNATGEYLLFLDSDDFLETNAVEILNDFLDKQKILPQIVAFNYFLFKDEKTLSNLYQTQFFTKEDFLTQKYAKQQDWILFNKAFDRLTLLQVLQNFGLNRERERLLFAEDAFVFFTAIFYTKFCGTLNEALYNYCINENQITKNKTPQKAKLTSQNIEFIIKQISKISKNFSKFDQDFAKIFCLELKIPLINEKRLIKKSKIFYIFTSFLKNFIKIKISLLKALRC